MYIWGLAWRICKYILGLKSHRPYSQGLSYSKPVERELIKEIIKEAVLDYRRLESRKKSNLKKMKLKSSSSILIPFNIE